MRHVFVGLFLFTMASLRAQSFTVVASFDGTNDYLPRAMVQGPDGSFYGVGGWFFLSTPGMVFKVVPDGTVTTSIHSAPSLLAPMAASPTHSSSATTAISTAPQPAVGAV